MSIQVEHADMLQAIPRLVAEGVVYEGGGQHSTQAKNRNRKVDHGPLFAEPPLTAAELEADSVGSYNAAVQAIGERVREGMPVPTFMRSRKAEPS